MIKRGVKRDQKLCAILDGLVGLESASITVRLEASNAAYDAIIKRIVQILPNRIYKIATDDTRRKLRGRP